ncbi:MAG: lipopolysaccharide assembly protein LapA domain-containing protein [Patescibacteria group bacterium]
MILSLFVGFILGAAALLFALQNTEVVSLVFMGWQFQSTLALLVLVSVGVGVLISVFASIPSAVGNHFRIRMLEKTNKGLVTEIEAYRQAERMGASPDPAAVIDLRT